jgi:hypothetical protein
MVQVVEPLRLMTGHPSPSAKASRADPTQGGKLVRPVGRCTLPPAFAPLPGGPDVVDGMTSRARFARDAALLPKTRASGEVNARRCVSGGRLDCGPSVLSQCKHVGTAP